MDTRGDWRRKVAEATGLPFTRVRALRRLSDGPLTLRDLAHSLGSDAPAATVAVNDLERRGLVARRAHPDDRRSKMVSLTTAGRAALRAARSVTDPVPEALATLPPEDVAALRRIFEGLGRRSAART
jgi:DNA-binding MarR family transcriptional regulator